MSNAGRRSETSRYLKEACIRAIYRDIVNGYSHSEIMERVIKDVYGIGYSANKYWANDLINMAMHRVAEDFEEERKIFKPKLVAVVNDILRQATECKDQKMRLESAKELAKLSGSYEPERVDVKQDIIIDFNLNDEG